MIWVGGARYEIIDPALFDRYLGGELSSAFWLGSSFTGALPAEVPDGVRVRRIGNGVWVDIERTGPDDGFQIRTLSHWLAVIGWWANDVSPFITRYVPTPRSDRPGTTGGTP